MSLLGKIVPLILLFIALAVAAFIGYAVYTIATDIADKTSKKMEKKNVSFGKEGMKIGVREVRTENYVDQTQSYVALSLALLFSGGGEGVGRGFDHPTYLPGAVASMAKKGPLAD